MPGKIVSFLKAGRLCIPVELYVISSSESKGQDDKISSNWIESKHWDDIKDMLKPAVELGLKCNSETNNIWDTSPGGPRIAYKDEMILGYIFVANKGKFTDLLDLRPISTHDDEELDEHSGLKDYGGQFKGYSPTRVYIKACVLLRNGNDLEDEKKITKELGVKPHLSFFQPLVSKVRTSSSSSSNK